MPDLPHTRFARSSSPRVQEECAMTQKSLSSETCLGYLSALQVHAFCRRRGIALATTRHRHFPSKAASRDQANDLTIRTCDPYLPAGIPMPLHCVSSSTSTPRSAEFRKPHLCRLPLSGNALQRWNESILLSSPSLAFIQEASLRSFVDTLFSDSSYVAHTSRRPCNVDRIWHTTAYERA